MAFQPGTSNRTTIRFVAEPTFNTTPASPALKNLRYTGEGLNFSTSLTTSEEIRDDRTQGYMITTGATVDGDLNFEMSYGSFDELIEAAFCGTWASNVLKNGTALRSFTFQKHFQDLLIPQFHNFKGVRIGGMSLDFQTGQILTGSFELMGCDADMTPSQFSGAVITSPGAGNPPMNAVNGLSGISKDAGRVTSTYLSANGSGYTSAPTVTLTGGGGTGATVVAVVDAGAVSELIITNSGSGYTTAPTVSFSGGGGTGASASVSLGGPMTTKIKSMSFNLSNNLRGQDAIGTLGYVGIALGGLEITGDIETYFESAADYQAFLNEQEFALQFTISDEYGKSYTILIPKVQYESVTINAGGLDEDLMMSGSWRALYDPVTQCAVQITRSA